MKNIQHFCPECGEELFPLVYIPGELAMEGFWMCKRCGEKFEISFGRISKKILENAFLEWLIKSK